METSGISNRSLNYGMERLTASVTVKKSRSETLTQGGEQGDVAAKLKEFGVEIEQQSYSYFETQAGKMEETLLSRLRKFQSEDAQAESGKASESAFKSAENAEIDAGDDLFGEEGYWGVDKTSQRISEFVIQGAGDDLQRLKAGREGMLKGFKEAEKVRGGELPDISYETMAKSLEAVDERIRELGGSVIDLST